MGPPTLPREAGPRRPRHGARRSVDEGAVARPSAIRLPTRPWCAAMRAGVRLVTVSVDDERVLGVCGALEGDDARVLLRADSLG